jgi:GntR family transcriptional regulator, arabinose operon transcriptional repressor
VGREIRSGGVPHVAERPDPEHSLLYERLYRHILDEVVAGRLQPGERVPSEKALAEQFGVSRITSQRAMRNLDRAGLVLRVRGKGSFVADPLPDLTDPDLRAGDARGQRTSTRTIALLVPEVAESYGLALMLGVEERATECGYYLLLRRSRDHRKDEDRAIDAFRQADVDGLIVFPVHGEYHNERLLRLVVDRFPLVVVDRPLRGVGACAVHTDNVQAARELTTYLLDQGHNEVAFLSPPPTHTSSIEDRLSGYLEASAQRGQTPARQHVMTTLYSTLPGPFAAAQIASDEAAIRQFLDERPQLRAFVACEYNIALLLDDVLRQLRPAGEYEIACFDSPDDPFGRPAFTHIEQDETAMGRTAVDLLTAQLAGEEVPPRTIIPHRLVIRDSSSDGSQPSG